jgi:hypothetical protein
MPSYSRKASASITPYSFVKQDVANLGQVLLCGAGDEIFGISQPGTRRVPYDGLDDGNAAIVGENVNIFGPPEKGVLLKIGGTVAIGDRLKSDAAGHGITTVTANDEVGAIAERAGVANDLIPVQTITARY